jgi:preprotein translocase subunit SecB
LSEPKALPLSGYNLLRVYLRSAELKAVPPPSEAKSHNVSFGWDWRFLKEPRAFEVLLTLAIEPSKEHPYSASVEAVGRFRQNSDAPAVEFERFVTLQAVAILLPYVRQYLTNLTVNTRAGAYYLPSVNVAELMKGIDLSESTGASQLAERAQRESTDTQSAK